MFLNDHKSPTLLIYYVAYFEKKELTWIRTSNTLIIIDTHLKGFRKFVCKNMKAVCLTIAI
jgi:hypothetical protein